MVACSILRREQHGSYGIQSRFVLMNIPALPCLQSVSFKHARVVLLVMVCACLSQPQLVQAKGGSSHAVDLIAPEEVREVLAQYFELPDRLLKDENERAVFMRRAQREIPELLATEGYFSGKVVLHSVSPAGVLELDVIPGPRTMVTE